VNDLDGKDFQGEIARQQGRRLFSVRRVQS